MKNEIEKPGQVKIARNARHLIGKKFQVISNKNSACPSSKYHTFLIGSIVTLDKVKSTVRGLTGMYVNTKGSIQYLRDEHITPVRQRNIDNIVK